MLKSRRNHLRVRNAVRPVVEGLEGRQMLSASLSHSGLLNVSGTAHADVISVTIDAQDSTLLDVSVNGSVKTFTAASVKRIAINGNGGNDQITLDSSIVIPATIFGGAGNDSLVAGGGADSLNGGLGNDSLVGGAGTDTLAGAAGNDTLVGGMGNDNMDGGVGNDSLQGGAGNCTLQGGLGNDTLMNGTGADNVNAGKGNDNVQFNPYGGVALDTLPAAVQTGLTTLAQGADISAVIVFQDDGHTFYGTEVTLGGVDIRIVVDASGNPATQPSSNDGQGDQGKNGNGSNGDNKTQQHYAAGTVISIDTSASTITVATNGVNTTYTITSQTVVYFNGAVSDLSTITVGANLSLALAADGTTVIAMGTSTPSNTGGGGEQQDTYVTGTIVSVDTTADTLLFSSGGVQTTYTFSTSTSVYLNGTASTLASITAGAAAGIKLAPDGTTIITIGVETPNNGGGQNQNPTPTPPTTNHYASGTVVSVDLTGNTVTVFNNGVNSSYNLTSQTVVYVNKAVSSLSAIAAGESLSIELAADGTTVLVMGTSTQDNSGGGGQNPTPTPPAPSTYVSGTIVSIDTTADTLTFSSQGAQATYTINSTTLVYLNGAASTLASVAAGQAATLKVASDGTTLLAIGAETSNTGGGGQNQNPTPKPQYAGGVVVSIDTTAHTVTVASGGVNTTYTITSQTVIYFNKAVSTLSAITPGANVSLEIAADGMTVIAIGTSLTSNS